MKSLVLGGAIAFSAVFCPLAAETDAYSVGDSFVGFSVPDQHGKQFNFKAGDAKFILFDTPGESGRSEHPQDPDWFAKHHILLVINISELSSIKRRIARSRMESKPFQLLVVDVKGIAERFPREMGKFSVLELNEQGTITAIRFASPGKDLQEAVAGEAP